MLYLTPTGANFATDRVSTDFDVEDFPESRKRMKPWEVRNAEDATTRRTHLLQWMRAVSEFKKQAVNGNSLPLTPSWQSRKR
jgi:hypothetical protein